VFEVDHVGFGKVGWSRVLRVYIWVVLSMQGRVRIGWGRVVVGKSMVRVE